MKKANAERIEGLTERLHAIMTRKAKGWQSVAKELRRQIKAVHKAGQQ